MALPRRHNISETDRAFKLKLDQLRQTFNKNRVELLVTAETGPLPDVTSIRRYFSQHGEVEKVEVTEGCFVVQLFGRFALEWLFDTDLLEDLRPKVHTVDGHRVQVELLRPLVYGCEMTSAPGRIEVNIGHEVINKITQSETALKEIVKSVEMKDTRVWFRLPAHIVFTSSRKDGMLLLELLHIKGKLVWSLRDYRHSLPGNSTQLPARERRISLNDSSVIQNPPDTAVGESHGDITLSCPLRSPCSSDTNYYSIMNKTVKYLSPRYPALEIRIDENTKSAKVSGPARTAEKAAKYIWSCGDEISVKDIPVSETQATMLKRPGTREWIQRTLDREFIDCDWMLQLPDVTGRRLKRIPRLQKKSSLTELSVTAFETDHQKLEQIFHSCISQVTVSLNECVTSFLQSDTWKLFQQDIQQTNATGEPAPVLTVNGNTITIVDLAKNIESTRRAVVDFLHNCLIQTTKVKTEDKHLQTEVRQQINQKLQTEDVTVKTKESQTVICWQDNDDLQTEWKFLKNERLQTGESNVKTEEKRIQTEPVSKVNTELQTEDSKMKTDDKQLQTESLHQVKPGLPSDHTQAEHKEGETEVKKMKSKEKQIQTESGHFKNKQRETDVRNTENREQPTEYSQQVNTGMQTEITHGESKDIQTEEIQVNTGEKQIQTECRQQENKELQTEKGQLENKDLQTENSKLKTEEKYLQTDVLQHENKQSQTENRKYENKNLPSESSKAKTEDKQMNTESRHLKSQSIQTENCQQERKQTQAQNTSSQTITDGHQSEDRKLQTEQSQVHNEDNRVESHDCRTDNLDLQDYRQPPMLSDADTRFYVQNEPRETTEECRSQTFPKTVIESQVDGHEYHDDVTGGDDVWEQMLSLLNVDQLQEVSLHLGISPDVSQHLQSRFSDSEALKRSLLERCRTASDVSKLCAVVLQLCTRYRALNETTDVVPAFNASAFGALVTTTNQTVSSNIQSTDSRGNTGAVVNSQPTDDTNTTRSNTGSVVNGQNTGDTVTSRSNTDNFVNSQPPIDTVTTRGSIDTNVNSQSTDDTVTTRSNTDNVVNDQPMDDTVTTRGNTDTNVISQPSSDTVTTGNNNDIKTQANSQLIEADDSEHPRPPPSPTEDQAGAACHSMSLSDDDVCPLEAPVIHIEPLNSSDPVDFHHFTHADSNIFLESSAASLAQNEVDESSGQYTPTMASLSLPPSAGHGPQSPQPVLRPQAQQTIEMNRNPQAQLSSRERLSVQGQGRGTAAEQAIAIDRQRENRTNQRLAHVENQLALVMQQIQRGRHQPNEDLQARMETLLEQTEVRLQDTLDAVQQINLQSARATHIRMRQNQEEVRQQMSQLLEKVERVRQEIPIDDDDQLSVYNSSDSALSLAYQSTVLH